MSKSLVLGLLFGIAAIALFLTAKARRESKPDYLKWANGYAADLNSTDSSDPSKNCSGRAEEKLRAEWCVFAISG